MELHRMTLSCVEFVDVTKKNSNLPHSPPTGVSLLRQISLGTGKTASFLFQMWDQSFTFFFFFFFFFFLILSSYKIARKQEMSSCQTTKTKQKEKKRPWCCSGEVEGFTSPLKDQISTNT
jgi:hypothetical protein